ncbi:hypothetical protein JCM1841_004316 [Sporobolomyces salmonicolor]
MAAKSSYTVQALMQKLKNPDADLRFMALNDLINEATQPGFGIDDATEHQLVDSVLSLLNDSNGEVKSVAVKTLATLTPSVAASRIQTIIDRLVHLSASTDEGVRDIASLGLKMVIAEVSPGSGLATTCCTKLAPEVVGQLGNASSSAELLIDSLDLLSDILSRFESTVRTLPALQQSILKAVIPLLGHGRAAVRKRAVMTIATLIPTTASSKLFGNLLSQTLLPCLRAPASSEQLLTSISLISSLARTSSAQLDPHCAEIVPLVLAASERDEGGEAAEVEVKEGVLMCLESLVLKCPAEMQGEMNNVVEKAVELLKFDPNYAGGNDDEDEEMGGVSDDEDLDDEFEEEYDDEDDTSWRVRRSAAKLLATCISTRPDLLSHFYKTVSPALIARFGDREETVKVEVWTTYTVLLKQTKVLAKGAGAVNGNGAPYGGASPRAGLKRKRSSEHMDTEEGPLSQLNSQTPNIVRSIVKQLNAKSLATRQAGFVLLHELISVLDGGLESQIPQLVGRVETALKSTDSGLSGAATSLKIEVLSLLALFFRTHHLKTFTDDLPKLVPLLVSAINDRFNKIAAEAFITSSSLIKALRPVTPTVSTLAPSLVAHLTAIYQATMQRLIGPDADEEVKGKGIQTLGTLLYHAGDYAAGDLAAALSFLRDRLKIEVQRIVAVQTVGQVASSPVCRGDELDAWVRDCLAEVSPLFRKVHRPLKIAAFECIDALLARAAAAGVPTETSSALLTDLQPLLTDQDVNLLPHALNTVATLLSIDPLSSTEIDDSILPRIFELVQSPLVQGPSLEGLLTFFQAYIKAGANPKPLLKKLGASADGVKKSVEASGTQSGMQSLVTASRCIGMIMKECPDVGEDVIIENEEVVKSANSSPAALILSLLTLGEVGRIIEFGSHQPVFARIVEHFSAESEDVRRSAAFSAGNIAVGNKEAFLPTILQLIQSDDKKRYLALQALKEVILHSSPESLAAISDQLWTPLFENCEAQEEGIRNIAADCLGHLTVSNPAKYLPQLQARLSSDSRHTRATVIAALRFTFTNDSTTYDELLAPLIVEFFKLMHDPDLGVRRLALASLNSAAHNKPHLVRDHLSTLLPELYAQTVVDESLIRIVEMGPFKHKVDDGLDIRKSAYECMHSLLDTCLKQIELQAYLSRVIAGLSDEEEVKKLCYVMLVKLAQVAPTAVTQRLDETVPAFTETLGVVLKDNATKQEAERTLELQKSTIRCIAVLNRLASPASTPKFSTYISTVVANGKMAGELKEAMKLSQTVAMDLD